ncbi:MAG: hypothetical protein CR975_07485 [Gammaproteobacteria bacterium]|nr:MAG: hypothetical protein CR975_07485 [Gammaproteobacteria bacterium]
MYADNCRFKNQRAKCSPVDDRRYRFAINIDNAPGEAERAEPHLQNNRISRFEAGQNQPFGWAVPDCSELFKR